MRTIRRCDDEKINGKTRAFLAPLESLLASLVNIDDGHFHGDVG
jgi:hypothetical protein